MTTTRDTITIAIMTIPLETRDHTETVRMVLTGGLYWEALTETLLDTRLSKAEVKGLIGPAGRDERHALGVSNDRAAWMHGAGDLLIKTANTPGDITPMDEYHLQKRGVMLLRIPRLVNEDSLFHRVTDDDAWDETYEEFTDCGHGMWAGDRLGQDFEAEFGIKEPGDTGLDLLDLMTLWVWYKDTCAMSDRLYGDYSLDIVTKEGYL